MRTSPRFRVAAVALLLASAAGCSDSPVEPRSDPVDLAAALSELSLPAIDAAGASVGLVLPSASLTRSGCAYDGSVQEFVCPSIVSNGLTVTGSYALLTASGTPQSAFDQTSTDAVRSTSSVVGTISETGATLDIEDHRTTTLSGLLSGHHVINGSGTSHMTGNFDGETFDETVTTSIAGLLPPLRGSNGYPRGGTITMKMDAAFSGLPSSTTTMTMTFNGTSKVAVTMTGFGFTQHCTLDLSQNGGGMSCSG